NRPHPAVRMGRTLCGPGPRLGRVRPLGRPPPAGRRAPGAPDRGPEAVSRVSSGAVPQPGPARSMAPVLGGRADRAVPAPGDRGDPRPSCPEGRHRGTVKGSPVGGAAEPRTGSPRGGFPRRHGPRAGDPGLLLLPRDVVSRAAGG